MADRYTPLPSGYGSRAIQVVVAIDTETGKPTCLYAGHDADAAKKIRNRAGKGKGGFSRLTHVRACEVAVDAKPRGVSLDDGDGCF